MYIPQLSSLINNVFIFIAFQVWFKNRRAKFRKQKREEQERSRKQEEHNGISLKYGPDGDLSTPMSMNSVLHSYSDADDSSDLEVAQKAKYFWVFMS